MPASETQPQNTEMFPLYGHRDVLHDIRLRFEQNRLHHGLLISGQSGIGKSRLAIQLAGWILSQRPDNTALFDEISEKSSDIWALSPETEDFRLVCQQAHPDLICVSSEQSAQNKSGQIKAEQIRGLSHFMAHSTSRGGWRVAIIDSLDDVNIHAANAMLKLLEEPPARTVLILLSSTPGRVIPTILSRCFHIKLGGLDMADSQSVLRHLWPDADDDYLNSHALLCDGVPGQAVTLSESGCFELFIESCAYIHAPQRDHTQMMMLAEKWGAAGRHAASLRQSAVFLFDRLLSQSALMALSPTLTNSPFLQLDPVRRAAESLAGRLTPTMLSTLHTRFIEMMDKSERLYLDPKPFLSEFFAELHSQNTPR